MQRPPYTDRMSEHAGGADTGSGMHRARRVGRLMARVVVGAAAATAAVVLARAGAAGPDATSAADDRRAPVPERDGVGERLARLIRIPTVSASVDETGPAPFERFEDELRELYPLLHERLEREKITQFGIVYHWRGADPTRPVVLMAHYDVVPAAEEDGWSHPPFDGSIVNGQVRGRGAIDDKGELVTLLEAVENLLAAGVEPPRDLYVSLGGNEETHGAAAREIARTLRERGLDPWLVLDEGGAVVEPPFPGVTRPMAMVGVAEKGTASFRLRVEGVGGHASLPRRRNAIVELSRALARLRRHPFPARMNVPLRGLLSGLRPAVPFGVRAIVANLWLFSRPLIRVLTLATPETNAMTRTTIAVTMIRGGSADNVLPAAAEAVLNIRIAPGDTVADVTAHLRRVLGPRVAIEPYEPSEPSPISPIDAPQFAAITAALGRSYPDALVSPYVMMQATDSRFFHQYAKHVYRLGPLYMTTAQRDGLHGIDEFVDIDALQRGTRFYEALILGLPVPE